MRINNNYSTLSFKEVNADINCSKMLKGRLHDSNPIVAKDARTTLRKLKFLTDISRDVFIKYDSENKQICISELRYPSLLETRTDICSGDDIIDTMDEAIDILSGHGKIKIDIPKDS